MATSLRLSFSRAAAPKGMSNGAFRLPNRRSRLVSPVSLQSNVLSQFCVTVLESCIWTVAVSFMPGFIERTVESIV